MTQLRLLIATALLAGSSGIPSMHAKMDPAVQSDLKPRVVILTDIAPGDREPDDMESLVRLLAYADQLEIEAIILSSGWNSSGGEYPESWSKYACDVIDAYKRDLLSLMKRSDQTGHMALEKEELWQSIGY